MLGVLIFLMAAVAPAAGSMLSPQILHNSMIKGPRLIFSPSLLRPNIELAQIAAGAAVTIKPEILLRLRGGKKGTASQGKRGTGHKAHPSYKYNLRQVNTIWQILSSPIANLGICPVIRGRAELMELLGSDTPLRKTHRLFKKFKQIMFCSNYVCTGQRADASHEEGLPTIQEWFPVQPSIPGSGSFHFSKYSNSYVDPAASF